MPELQAAVGELHGTITITRKTTGLTETFRIVGKVNHEQAEALGLPTAKPVEGDSDDTGTQHHGA